MPAIEDKMCSVAKHFNGLNAKGNVKAFKAHEKGYSRIQEIVRGGVLLVHHLNDDRLIIDLMFTASAMSRYSVECNKAVDTFNKQFGSEVKSSKWLHSVDNSKYYRHEVDVTYIKLSDLLVVIQEIKNKLAHID